MYQAAIRAIPNNFHTISPLNRGMGDCKHIFQGKKGFCHNILRLIVGTYFEQHLRMDAFFTVSMVHCYIALNFQGLDYMKVQVMGLVFCF